MHARRKIAVNPVRKATLFAHFSGQARDKTTAAQHIVAHQQGEKIGVISAMSGLPQHHMRLRGRHGHALVSGPCQRRYLGHGRQFVALRPLNTGQQLGHDGIGLRTVYCTHQTDPRIARPNVALPPGGHVGHGNAGQGVGRDIKAIGM